MRSAVQIRAMPISFGEDCKNRRTQVDWKNKRRQGHKFGPGLIEGDNNDEFEYNNARRKKLFEELV